jgi:hypothetical protein
MCEAALGAVDAHSIDDVGSADADIHHWASSS